MNNIESCSRSFCRAWTGEERKRFSFSYVWHGGEIDDFMQLIPHENLSNSKSLQVCSWLPANTFWCHQTGPLSLYSQIAAMLPQVREQSSLNINQCSFSETFHLWMRMWRRRARGGRGWRTIAALAEEVTELPNPMLIWSKHIFWVWEGSWKVILFTGFFFHQCQYPCINIEE